MAPKPTFIVDAPGHNRSLVTDSHLHVVDPLAANTAVLVLGTGCLAGHMLFGSGDRLAEADGRGRTIQGVVRAGCEDASGGEHDCSRSRKHKLG